MLQLKTTSMSVFVVGIGLIAWVFYMMCITALNPSFVLDRHEFHRTLAIYGVPPVVVCMAHIFMTQMPILKWTLVLLYMGFGFIVFTGFPLIDELAHYTQ